jgi:mono/diheme cytochrome c family protein
MVRNVKRLATTSLILFVLALLPVELVIRATASQRRRSPARSRGAPVGDLFRNNCARCHGGDGRGDTTLGHTYKAPDFTDPEWWRKHSDITTTARLTSIVSRGKGGMPAFGKKLTRTEIRSLVGYVRRFKNQTSSN